jgi:DNA-binding response OmpR family regulator
MPTVLFVEDDPLVMLSAATTLEDHGWTVKKAAHGKVAMERFPELSADVDVVLVDLRLGQGPTGWDVAKFARAHSTRMPVAYITGDDSLARENPERVQGAVILRKPVSDRKLLATLRTLIGQDRAGRAQPSVARLNLA